MSEFGNGEDGSGDDGTSHPRHVFDLPPDEACPETAPPVPVPVTAPEPHSPISDAFHAALDHPVCTFCFAGALAFFAGILFSSGDMPVMIVAAIIGWLLATVAWIYAPNLSSRSKLLWIVVTAILFVAEVGILYLHYRPVTPIHHAGGPAVPAKPPAIDRTIRLSCKYVAYPNPAPETGIEELEIDKDGGKEDSPHFPATVGKSWANGLIPIYQCSMSNLGHTEFASTRVEMRMFVRETASQYRAVVPGDLIRFFPWSSPSLDLRPDQRNANAFYIWNHSKYWVHVFLPTTATVMLVGEGANKTVRLVEPPMSSFDLEPFPFQHVSATHSHKRRSFSGKRADTPGNYGPCSIGGNAVINAATTQDCGTHIGTP